MTKYNMTQISDTLSIVTKKITQVMGQKVGLFGLGATNKIPKWQKALQKPVELILVAVSKEVFSNLVKTLGWKWKPLKYHLS